MIKKLTAISLIIIFCLSTLTGCYNAEGIDKGENDKIRFSLQFALLGNSSGGSGRRQ